MIPDKFTYLAPTSLPEVWQALQAHPDDAKILAGGQSLIPLMKFRLAAPAYLVDISAGRRAGRASRNATARWRSAR